MTDSAAASRPNPAHQSSAAAQGPDDTPGPAARLAGARDAAGENAGLVARGLRKSYPTPAEDLLILDQVDFTLAPGDKVAIMGPSGSGKSTFLHLLGGLDRPTGGTLRVLGRDLLALSASQLADFRNQTVGFVFQDHHLLPQCTVLENVLIPTLPRGGADAAAVTRANELIAQVGLANRVTHRPAELSGGERQRVAIARALINQPALILGDEPTGNLDQANAATITQLLVDLADRHQAMLVLVTHSRELANHLPTRYVLRDYRLHRED